MLHANKISAVDGGAAAPAPKRPNVQMPDEYLPPNKILFLQNLPESVTKDQLMALFSQYVTAKIMIVLIIYLLLPDTPTFTKFVSFQQSEISLSWNSWTKEVRALPRTRCITTNWTERTRSKYVWCSSSLDCMLMSPCRSRSPGSSRMYLLLLCSIIDTRTINCGAACMTDYHQQALSQVSSANNNPLRSSVGRAEGIIYQTKMFFVACSYSLISDLEKYLARNP